MKFYFTFTICTLFACRDYGQVKKVFISSNGDYINESKKAVSYILIQKNSDSDYYVQKYNLKDTILMKGDYKDSILTVPNGKFVFYRKRAIPENLKGTARMDTNNYVNEVGYYLNGAKTGMWMEFYRRNVKSCSYIYKNNKLNGVYQKFHKYVAGYVVEEGLYIDDKKDGEWNVYGYDTLKTPLVTQVFKDGKFLKQVNHFKLAYFTGDINKYIRKNLKIPDTLHTWLVEAEITITKNGALKNPRLIRSSLPPNINVLLLPTLENISGFVPEFHDGLPEEIKYILLVSREDEEHSLVKGFGFSLTKEVGNGIFIEDYKGLITEHSLWPNEPLSMEN